MTYLAARILNILQNKTKLKVIQKGMKRAKLCEIRHILLPVNETQLHNLHTCHSEDIHHKLLIYLGQ